jgi:hypothetical protein
MKSMTCLQLAGACDERFSAETFDEIAEMSKAHGMGMFQKGDEAHIKAMNEMMQMMQDSEAMEKWFAAIRAEFEKLPDDN